MPEFDGSYAEVVRAPIDQISLVDDDIELTAASALPFSCLSCIQAMKDAFTSEKNLLVLGAGSGVGLMALRT